MGQDAEDTITQLVVEPIRNALEDVGDVGNIPRNIVRQVERTGGDISRELQTAGRSAVRGARDVTGATQAEEALEFQREQIREQDVERRRLVAEERERRFQEARQASFAAQGRRGDAARTRTSRSRAVTRSPAAQRDFLGL